MQIGSKCVLYMSMKYKNGWETTQPQRKKKTHAHTSNTCSTCMLRCVGLKINPRTYLRCGAYNLLPHRSDTQQCSVDPCSGRVILMKIYRRNAMLTHYLYAVRAFFSAPNVTGARCAMYVAFKGADVWFFVVVVPPG